jgi:rhodanese-related sulfurtransferase
VVQFIHPAQAQSLIESGEVDVIDVREPHEWASGSLPGARLISLRQFKTNPGSALLQDGVLFVCAAGVRSEVAARLAVQSGLTKVYNLSGGTKAWVKAGLPLEIAADAGAARAPAANANQAAVGVL